MVRIFIGSSTKSLPMAKEIASSLREKHEVILWRDLEAFKTSEFTYLNLEKHSKSVDAALFILGKDDKISKNRGPQWITRDNVLIESGLFAGALGIKRVALIAENGTKIASDFDGLTLINTTDSEKIKRIINWIEDISILPPIMPNNVFLANRQTVEKIIRVEDRMGIKDESYKHIRALRFANFACNSLLTPRHVAAIHHQNAILHDYCRLALTENAILEVIIQSPGCSATTDAERKMKNEKYTNWKPGPIFDSYLAYHLLIKVDEVFKKAHDEGRFIFCITEVSLPYGIFDVEYEQDYDYRNSVKIDTYCPELSRETERRSYVIWKRNDPENYQYYLDKFSDLKNSSLTVQVDDSIKPQHHDEWIELAKEKGRIWINPIDSQPIYMSISL